MKRLIATLGLAAVLVSCRQQAAPIALTKAVVESPASSSELEYRIMERRSDGYKGILLLQGNTASYLRIYPLEKQAHLSLVGDFGKSYPPGIPEAALGGCSPSAIYVPGPNGITRAENAPQIAEMVNAYLLRVYAEIGLREDCTISSNP